VVLFLIAAVLVALSVAALKPAPRQTRFDWGAGLGLLVSLALATRLGGSVLFVAGPLVLWMLLRWFRWDPQSNAERTRPTSGPREAMTREQALRILGLLDGATREAISSAHHQLIKKVHPDQGGSDFLAQQVNEAKKVLDSSQP
jgi:hypothetical protein